MSKSSRACIRVTALKIGLIRSESRKKFPKIIGLSCFLSHHRSFNLFGKGRCDWFLLTLGSRGNFPSLNTKFDFLFACCTSQASSKALLITSDSFSLSFNRRAAKARARSCTSSAFKRVRACGATSKTHAIHRKRLGLVD